MPVYLRRWLLFCLVGRLFLCPGNEKQMKQNTTQKNKSGVQGQVCLDSDIQCLFILDGGFCFVWLIGYFFCNKRAQKMQNK